ncbi:phenylacetate--CoA ligase family protein (plasmid) [Sphingomonas paeninsulae]|uniref:Phenylacetate--CoA ligase family protein n=2 Tax=Sphingomonas paeninsulae TaxID=2319844 RepID=A0A494T845_SPHPE|nr:phenylacetate--CoA ligase family protein [Sphingomonas paeninsulae]
MTLERGVTVEPGVANLDYFDPQIETLPRDKLKELQQFRLLGLLPYAYERSGLIRQVWDAAGVHPSQITSLADYVAKAPFIDKDAIRAFRDANDDPCGGIRIADYTEIPHVGFTSGTTGDPTPVPNGKGSAIEAEILREFWHVGGRPGDYITYLMFTFRGGISRTSFLGDAGFTPITAPHDPAILPLIVDAIEQYRPTVLYMLSTPMMMGLEAYFEKSAKDPRNVFKSIKGAVFGGEPMSPRFKALAKSWGLEIFDYTTFGDVTGAMECREHNGFHGWEDLALAECLDANGNEVADGEVGELVVTALTDQWAPLIRFRTGDLVKFDRSPCPCGRTHLRFWTLGRMGDQTLVQGVSVLPRDIQGIVEQQPETRAALFQIIRPQAEMEVLRLRVGYDAATGNPAGLAKRLTDSVTAALKVPCEVELVPNEELLKLGPPQKIPRVTKQ